jgi:hypothetical protein
MGVRGGRQHGPARPAGARRPGPATRPSRGAAAVGRRPGWYRHRCRRRGGRRCAGHLADQLGQGALPPGVGQRRHPGRADLSAARAGGVREPGRQLELRAGPERLAGPGRGRRQPGAAGADLGVERHGAGPRAAARECRPGPARGRREGRAGPAVCGLGLGPLQRLRPAGHRPPGRGRRQGGLQEDRDHAARPGVGGGSSSTTPRPAPARSGWRSSPTASRPGGATTTRRAPPRPPTARRSPGTASASGCSTSTTGRTTSTTAPSRCSRPRPTSGSTTTSSPPTRTCWPG